MSPLDRLPRLEIASRNELRAWLRRFHKQERGVWVVTFKKSEGDRHVSYDEVVEELLCFGWVDSMPRSLDERRSMRLATPRKPSSKWSRLNKERVERLTRARKMTRAGLEAIERARATGGWSALDQVEELVVPPDLTKRFAAYAGARKNFEAFPRSAKRQILEWIDSAKRSQTRAKRVDEAAALAAKNERANQWRRG